MNYPKDIYNSNPEDKGHSNYSLIVQDKSLLFLSKKTDRLVTALYMITDFMSESEPIRTRLRTLGVECIELARYAGDGDAFEQKGTLTDFAYVIDEIRSLVRIAGAVGLVSAMNASILEREFESLNEKLTVLSGDSESRSSIPGFSLAPEFFAVEEDISPRPLKYGTPLDKGHDFYKGQKNISDVLYKKEESRPIQKSDKSFEVAVRLNRRNSILKIIKDTSASKNGGVMIKDITNIIKDRSEKTIQRELGAMVAEGILKQSGKKRWSTYSIANRE